MPPPEQFARKNFIDTELQSAGWLPIVPFSPDGQRHLVVLEEYPTAAGPADYMLFHEGRPLAIVEAKKVGVSPQNVTQQAQRYARGMTDSPFDFHGFGVPFIYATNGKQIWFQDLRNPRSSSREISKFHTPAALREMLERDPSRYTQWLRDHSVDHPILRDYQREAILSIEHALIGGRRKLLVAMATGTGKTKTTIALIYRLMKSGLARRVLFLVDRRALAAQSVVEFARFEAERGLKFNKIYEVYSQRFRREDIEEDNFDPLVLPSSYLTNPDESKTFVYVSTIQRMRINLFGQPPGVNWGGGDVDEESDAMRLDIPIHAFDLIIADESHRGYTASEESKWREVLNHFDASTIGLTATPAAHTVAYFGEMVYSYDYERAVREGWLVDYDTIAIQSELRITGTFLQEGEEVGLLDRETGEVHYEVLEDERELPPPVLEKDWSSPDRDRKLVAELVRLLREKEQELGRFPKTLIFADNDLQHGSHADRLVLALRDAFGMGDDFVQKITGSPSVDRPLQRIREFRNRPEPKVVVTVDMLSTGVDIPSLECIVFLRPVRSRILFTQMMGRGTRLCEEIHKTHFTVYDAAGVLEYFAGATDFTAEAPNKPQRTIPEIVNDLYNNRNRQHNLNLLVKRLQRMAKEITGEGREQFARFVGHPDVGKFAAELPDLLDSDWLTTMNLLRNPEFQRLLANYPRAKDDFTLAIGAEDVITSGRLIHLPNGQSVRPDDYLLAFAHYVSENPDHVDAIRILLERPADWRTDALQELRDKLKACPEGFTEQRLRQAYQHNLADIISMVKHAASGEPLYSAEERVDRALRRVISDHTFTAQQQKWLELIRIHLIENLAIDRQDFNLIAFRREGAAWDRVNADFDGELESLIKAINTAVAA